MSDEDHLDEASSRPRGRPSKYEPRFCEEVVEAMLSGHSLSGFAGKIGVARSTLNEWIAAHSDFSEACSRAKAAAAYCWEQRANRVAAVGGGPGTAQVVLFALKNVAPDDWSFASRARISLPNVDSAKSAMAAIGEALAAFGRGEIDQAHAEAIVAIARSYLGAVETVEVEDRLKALEQARK